VCWHRSYGRQTPSPPGTVFAYGPGEPDLTVNAFCPVTQHRLSITGKHQRRWDVTSEAARKLAKMLDDGYLRDPLVQINRIGYRFHKVSSLSGTFARFASVHAV